MGQVRPGPPFLRSGHCRALVGGRGPHGLRVREGGGGVARALFAQERGLSDHGGWHVTPWLTRQAGGLACQSPRVRVGTGFPGGLETRQPAPLEFGELLCASLVSRKHRRTGAGACGDTPPPTRRSSRPPAASCPASKCRVALGGS